MTTGRGICIAVWGGAGTVPSSIAALVSACQWGCMKGPRGINPPPLQPAVR